MTVQLWACRRRSTSSQPCHGFKYVEPGEDPGTCDHETLTTPGGFAVVRVCNWPMDLVGEFEVEFA